MWLTPHRFQHFLIILSMNSVMIYHIIEEGLWEEIKNQNYFRPESLEGEGFVHFSKEDQVEKIADFQDRNVAETLVLEIDEERLDSELRFEGDEEKFPHLYGPLNLGAVVSVRSLGEFLDE